MPNNKKLQEIKGTDTVAGTWRYLLDRDRNISNLFSGNDFTTDQDPTVDVGRPNWRTDLRRLFILNADGTWTNLFTLIEPYELKYSVEHPDVPSSIVDVKAILDLLVNRNNLNTITLPTDGVRYTADGETNTYALPRYSSNKYSLFIFIDGVKQDTTTYELSSDGLSVVFGKVPTRGENIEILNQSSITEWDYSPSIDYFTGDGSTTEFTASFDLLHANTTSVNIDGLEIQKNQFSVDGHKVTLISAPSSGAKIQITYLGKTSFVTASPNSIGTTELKAKAVTVDKLDDGIVFTIDKITNGSIITAMLASGAVTTDKLGNSSVTNAKLNNGAVNEDKLASSVKVRLLGSDVIATNMLKDKCVTRAKISDSLLNDYYTKTEVNALINALEARIAALEGE